MDTKTLAIFDLDGTITSKDTFLEFIKYSKGKFSFYSGFCILLPFIVLYFLKVIKNNKLKEIVFGYFFKKLPSSEVNEKGKQFAREILPRLCYSKALSTLKNHQEKNHQILILTASSPIWLKAWCDDNGFDIIGTEFETKNGKYTGNINGENCYGIQKEKIVRSLLSQKKYDLIYGYGDSQADNYFLKHVTISNFGAIK